MTMSTFEIRAVRVAPGSRGYAVFVSLNDDPAEMADDGLTAEEASDIVRAWTPPKEEVVMYQASVQLRLKDGTVQTVTGGADDTEQGAVENLSYAAFGINVDVVYASTLKVQEVES